MLFRHEFVFCNYILLSAQIVSHLSQTLLKARDLQSGYRFEGRKNRKKRYILQRHEYFDDIVIAFYRAESGVENVLRVEGVPPSNRGQDARDTK
jgi:hypothetical protein